MVDGERLHSSIVLSNATPYKTFMVRSLKLLFLHFLIGISIDNHVLLRNNVNKLSIEGDR